MLSYLINVALLVALLAATGYMILVNRRLRALRSGQDQIGPMIENFARITGEMTETLTRLKADAGEQAARLEDAIGRAEALRGDIDRTLASASVEAKVLARQVATIEKGDLAAKRSAPAPARETVAEDKGPVAPDPVHFVRREGGRSGFVRLFKKEQPPAAGHERPAVHREEQSAPEQSAPRPWVPPRARSGLRAEALETFYGEAESA